MLSELHIHWPAVYRLSKFIAFNIFSPNFFQSFKRRVWSTLIDGSGLPFYRVKEVTVHSKSFEIHFIYTQGSSTYECVCLFGDFIQSQLKVSAVISHSRAICCHCSHHLVSCPTFSLWCSHHLHCPLHTWATPEWPSHWPMPTHGHPLTSAVAWRTGSETI